MFLPTNLRPHLGHVHSAPRALTAQASLIKVTDVDGVHDWAPPRSADRLGTHLGAGRDEKAITAIGFLRRALAFYRSLGVEVQRVMTDNGAPYVSFAHAATCRALGLRHIRTRPYRPRTNGKAERFIRTMLGECIYAAVYQGSEQRRKALQTWVER